MTSQQILDKLISIPVLGGEPNLEIIHWIKEYIESFGLKTYMVYNPDKTKASIHCKIGPDTAGGIVLSGHTDVVPVEGQNWSTNPFEMVDKGDGKLYGRGTCDMKGFNACCLSMLPVMVKTDLKKPIFLAFSYDEEIGCLGAPDLIQDILNTYTNPPKYAIIGEPTLMQPVIGQKGICTIKTTVNGSAGHSSRVKQEVSAIHEACNLVVWLENKMNKLIEEGSVDDRFTPNHTSIHVGQIDGGIAPNIIADKVEFLWDIRCIPKNTVSDIISDFKKYCDYRISEKKSLFPDFKISTELMIPPVPPLDTNENSSILNLIQDLTGNKTWQTVAYAAEAGQFSEAGIESIICGPGSIAQAHRENEFIEKSELVACENMLKNLIEYLSV